jgi:flagellar basal-body rod protein FlgG
MNGAFYIGAVGMESQQRALEVVANNIANINTPAFKRTEARFWALTGAADATDVTAAAATGGVMSKESAPVFAQGELRTTNSPMDLAIDGDGFIELQGADGKPLLWRGGQLTISTDGFLSAAGIGLPLKAMISIPREATGVTIGRDGEVRAVTGNASAPDATPGEVIGRLDIVRARDGALTAGGGGLYQAENLSDLTTAKPGDDGAGVLVQGAIEGSNVQLADQMVTLMLMQRAFAANAQVLQAGDQLMAIANTLRR